VFATATKSNFDTDKLVTRACTKRPNQEPWTPSAGIKSPYTPAGSLAPVSLGREQFSLLKDDGYDRVIYILPLVKMAARPSPDEDK